jgi:hypothetical protein
MSFSLQTAKDTEQVQQLATDAQAKAPWVACTVAVGAPITTHIRNARSGFSGASWTFG